MTPLEKFQQDIVDRATGYRDCTELQSAARSFMEQIDMGQANYGFNFLWLGVPIIQLPQDIQALQEIIWQVKPDLIIETGIAWGGSLLFSASMLAILEACELIENGRVVGIDIEIRPHNKVNIAAHPLAKKLTMLEGSSIDAGVVAQVGEIARQHKRVLVCLDSNHTHDHVLAELEAYAPMVTPGSYCVVSDTRVEDAAESSSANRPWGHGNNPKTAVWEYLERLKTQDRKSLYGQPMRYEIDRLIEDKIILTGSPDGHLKRIE